MFTAVALILSEAIEAAFTVSSVIAVDAIVDAAAPALTEWIGADYMFFDTALVGVKSVIKGTTTVATELTKKAIHEAGRQLPYAIHGTTQNESILKRAADTATKTLASEFAKREEEQGSVYFVNNRYNLNTL